MKIQQHTEQAQRYLDNANDILKTKAGRENGFYKDPKYVSVACGTAYKGVLLALDEYLEKKGKHIVKKKRQRIDVADYRRALATFNKKLLNHFNVTYSVLHLSGYYDAILGRTVIDAGMKEAENIISGVQQNKF